MRKKKKKHTHTHTNTQTHTQTQRIIKISCLGSSSSVLLLLFGAHDVSQVALSAIVTIHHGGHEDSGTTLFRRALLASTLDFAVRTNLVVLEHSQLLLLVSLFSLLRLGVHFLLSLRTKGE